MAFGYQSSILSSNAVTTSLRWSPRQRHVEYRDLLTYKLPSVTPVKNTARHVDENGGRRLDAYFSVQRRTIADSAILEATLLPAGFMSEPIQVCRQPQ